MDELKSRAQTDEYDLEHIFFESSPAAKASQKRRTSTIELRVHAKADFWLSWCRHGRASGTNGATRVRASFFRIAMFGSITFVFGLFVFGGFYRMLLYIGAVLRIHRASHQSDSGYGVNVHSHRALRQYRDHGTLDAISFGRSITSR